MKLRMKTWYWGKFVTSPLPNTNMSDYEPYIEEIHGWHHSEEYKKMKTQEEKQKEFEELSKPLIKFLNDNFHPQTAVIIDCDSAQIFEGVMGVSIKGFIKD